VSPSWHSLPGMTFDPIDTPTLFSIPFASATRCRGDGFALVTAPSGTSSRGGSKEWQIAGQPEVRHVAVAGFSRGGEGAVGLPAVLPSIGTTSASRGAPCAQHPALPVGLR